jgi:UDP-N-acetylmuramate dehydrogenase
LDTRRKGTSRRFSLLQIEPFAKYTAARLGGSADWLFIARESNEQLVEVVSAAWAQGVPVRVLGGGANVLVSDAGFRGLVVINRVGKAAFND